MTHGPLSSDESFDRGALREVSLKADIDMVDSPLRSSTRLSLERANQTGKGLMDASCTEVGRIHRKHAPMNAETLGASSMQEQPVQCRNRLSVCVASPWTARISRFES
jgi:hypothetical protein